MPSHARIRSMATSIDFGAFEVLSFDCYGTLIDWESGILAATRPVLASRGVVVADDELLTAFARAESAAEHGEYRSYREILARSLRGMAGEFGVEVTDSEAAAFGASVGDWPPFPDSAEALAALAEEYSMAVITNCDDDLFALSEARLGIRFDHVITAQQCRGYKPRLENFRIAHERIGVPPGRILHIAQSLFHDHAPAKQLGMTTVWVNRRAARGGGSGATMPSDARPDLEVPDMATVARLAAGG